MATVIKRTPQKTDIYITAGDSLRLRLVAKNPDGSAIDLTGKTVEASINPGSGAELIPFDVTVDAGVIELFLGKTASRGLPKSSAWDCEVIESPEVGLTILAGTLNVAGEVSDG